MPAAFKIALPDSALAPALREKIDQKTKPLGALGRLEALAMQAGLVQQDLMPEIRAPHMLVFAGDHGAARAGVSAYPQEVTAQMVANYLAGGAAINVFCRLNGLALSVVDAGVAHPIPRPHGNPGEGTAPVFISARIAAGTDNYLEGPAMSVEARDLALARGAEIVRRLAGEGTNVLGFGEMGIGNTASAALLAHALTGAPLAECVGRGAGLSDAGLERKRLLLSRAFARAGLVAGETDARMALAEFGGFEIAMMTGAMLAGAEAGMLLLIDGFIVSVAALIAARLAPALAAYCVFCHRSAEPGHRAVLAALGAEPLLDLELRLGEGTGAALAYPLLVAAVSFLRDMASFSTAGISGKSEGGV
ncbi:MAG: nicotinate-nucleotide--dimethylbenzimidazole phosphoribosyltransferase [Zoogloeaceae bacterium]|jgi:nicotinate-nucleotide--dimethylbenzimidazole phosphoribosyltransferase|nr:nicotinate-nucleotide--dimethylbenzimidazole phosphoribosyltransferase [Zoogloeaceae bacterium]